MTKSVCLLTSNLTAANKLKNVFNENFRVQKYDIEAPPRSIDWLVVEEKFQIQDNYYNVCNLWNDYLKDRYNQPTPKISIITKHRQSYENNNNFLYFSDLNHQTVQTAYERAKDVKSFEPNLSNVDNIRGQLEKFFTGHGTQSLFLKLNYLRMAVINTEESITGENGRTFDEASIRMIPMAKELWNAFLERWDNYEVYFKYTPFSEGYQKIPPLINQLRPFFQIDNPTEEEFHSFAIRESIEKTRSELKKMDKYVRPEIYEENYSFN